MEFLASEFADAFISVLAIIGIILVGGFLIFFLGDLVLSVLDPQYMHFWQRKKNGVKIEEKAEVKELENTETNELEFKFDDADEDAFVKEEEPVQQEEQPAESVEEAEEAKEDEVDLEAEEEQYRQNMLREIEQRRQKQEETNFDKFFFDDEDINVFNDDEDEGAYGQEEITEAPAEETNKVELVEEETEPVVEEAEEETQAEEEAEEVEEEAQETAQNNMVEELRAQFEAEIAKLQARNEQLEKELGEKEVAVQQTSPAGSIEEYEARLETLKDRLTTNEKELRKVKKEYLPLRRVNKTLENDERKLRRKEAIVAKQKVVLYGVNNIADIDEEKAKKLSEELDLLEGLKLSVQHCQEVMNANKDRYPILENTFNILTNNNEAIKADIKATEEAIETLKAQADNETDAE